MRVPPVPQILQVPDAEKTLRSWELYLGQLQEIVDGYQATIDSLQASVTSLETTATGLQNQLDTINASRAAVMLDADNAAIGAGTVPVVVTGLTKAVKIGEEWFVEWILDVAQSVTDDVLSFKVLASAGTFTGRYTVLGLNGVAGTWGGGVDILEAAVGAATAASDFAPGGKTAGGITTVVIRARGMQSVADGTLQIALVATDASGAASGTATVKAHSLMLSRKAV